jgi:hypothetical protein
MNLIGFEGSLPDEPPRVVWAAGVLEVPEGLRNSVSGLASPRSRLESCVAEGSATLFESPIPVAANEGWVVLVNQTLDSELFQVLECDQPLTRFCTGPWDGAFLTLDGCAHYRQRVTERVIQAAWSGLANAEIVEDAMCLGFRHPVLTALYVAGHLPPERRSIYRMLGKTDASKEAFDETLERALSLKLFPEVR